MRVLTSLPFILLAICAARAHAGDLAIHIDHVQENRGTVFVAIHRAETSYLDKNDNNAFRVAKAPAEQPGVTLTFPQLPPGQYAVKVFHDLNGDGVLNRSLFGAPTEPYGISNNVRAHSSLPAFSSALVEVPAAGTEISITLARH